MESGRSVRSGVEISFSYSFIARVFFLKGRFVLFWWFSHFLSLAQSLFAQSSIPCESSYYFLSHYFIPLSLPNSSYSIKFHSSINIYFSQLFIILGKKDLNLR